MDTAFYGYSLIRRSLFLIIAVVLFTPSGVQAQSGLGWLANQGRSDGSYAAPDDIAIPFQATAETLRTFYALGQTRPGSLAAAHQFLDSDPYPSTEHLALRILARMDAGHGVSDLIPELIAHANGDGGFGELPGYDSTALDTALALQALAAAGYQQSNAATAALGFLLATQEANGGWTNGENAASVPVTAHAILALSPFQGAYTGVSASMSAARGFLISQRAGNSLWHEDFQTALAVNALLASGADISIIKPSADALGNRQLPDGSWSRDVYTTALAIRVLSLYQLRMGNSNGATGSGTVTGHVVKELTGEPIANATVFVSSQPELQVKTNTEGFFQISGIPDGIQTLVAQKPGFMAFNSRVTVQIGQTVDAGLLVLALEPSAGMVKGRVADAGDGSPLENAVVTLAGANNYSATTGPGGDFELTAVAPGDYSVDIAKAGYYPVTGTATVTAGQTLVLNQELLREGAFLDSSPVDLRGKVIDALTGLPLSGATILLDSGQTTVTNGSGAFVIPALGRGSYRATVQANGYAQRQFSLLLNPGASGDIGILELYRDDRPAAPTDLTLFGRVIDSVSGAAITGATVDIASPATQLSTDQNGEFILAGVNQLTLEITIRAPGYSDRLYTITASGFGELQQEFPLPPASDNPTATVSTLSGFVTDRTTGAAISGSKVSLTNGATVTTDATGHYELSGIDTLQFTLTAGMSGYQTVTRQIQLSAHGNYSLDLDLTPLAQSAGSRFQIVTFDAPANPATAGSELLFSAEISNISSSPQEALITGVVLNGNDEVIATLSPYAPGTTAFQSSFLFDPGESKTLVLPWPVAQTAPGAYRVLLRVVEPGSITRSLPTGSVLAESESLAHIGRTQAFSGALELNPPLTQAGAQTPVALNALVINHGNVPLENTELRLLIKHPDTGQVIHQAVTVIGALAVGDNRLLAFGDWIPTVEGNLPVTVQAVDGRIAGEINGTLYVGDKASGTFTVDRTVVPEGTQSVHGTITLEGVDTARGSVIDPLFAAVQNAVRSGGEYTAREALNWQKRNRCLGCHIQSQSLVGVASAYRKGLGNELSANTLYNTLASSRQNDGGLRANHPQFTRTQTALGVWALSGWDDLDTSFRTLYRAAGHLYDRRSQSGNQTWWSPDHSSGWWRSNASHTAMAVKAFVRLIEGADRIAPDALVEYRRQLLAGLGNGQKPRDLEVGPGGGLYTVKSTGEILRIDPDTGAIETVARLGIDGYGLALADDGSIYVSGAGGKLLRWQPGGTVETLLSGGGILTDVEIAPDGRLLVVDYSNHRILRVDGAGQTAVLAQGGLLRNPYGLAFDPEGNAIIANHGGWNIVRLAVDNTLSVFADGLAYRPIWITPDPAGGFFYSSSAYSSAGQWTPPAINHLSVRGVVERLITGNTLRGIAVSNGRVFTVSANANQIFELIRVPLDTSRLADFAGAVDRAVNFFLARYRDGSSDNIVQAMRLMGLGEARKVISDNARLATIDAAMAAIADTLRARQRGDGGWGRYTGWGSDAMVTALVGLALDYTNPSADDPVVRKTIRYLLSSQQSDHSWRSNNGILSTRLAATSLVITYLPVALERLGGIDVDLHVTLPDSVSLTAPSVPLAGQTPGASGGTDYLWRLLGVTSRSRQIEFDLTLRDMQLDEVRAVASQAYIEFDNSFTGEKVRVDLPVPTVTAASELKLGLALDRAIYSADDTVAIALAVDNTGPTPQGGVIDLAILPQTGTEPVATLPAIPVEPVATGGRFNAASQWLTGDTLAGDYQVVARLLDAQGRKLDEKAASFRIVHGQGAVIGSGVTTDKPVYQAWDQVAIQGRVNNLSANTIHPATIMEVTVATPAGDLLWRDNAPLPELQPGALRDLPFALALADAVAGQYTVTLTVKDAFSRDPVTTSQTQFTVERQPLQALTGKVEAVPLQVYQGDSVQCSETVTNIGSTPLSGLQLSSQLYSMDTGALIRETKKVMDLGAGQMSAEIRPVATDALDVGAYACVLTALMNGQTRQLGAAGFDVLEPPIKIDAGLVPGGTGRLLILLDPEGGEKECDHDGGHEDHDPSAEHHGKGDKREASDSEDDRNADDHSSDEKDKSDDCGHGDPDDEANSTASVVQAPPGLNEQRAYLEQVLNDAGWSYTIVTDKEDFAVQFHGGGYTQYALLAERVKLTEQVQKELREAVFRGEGLVVAGSHDHHHHDELDEVLGVKFKGKYSHASGVTLPPSDLGSGGADDFLFEDEALRVEPEGAEIAGRFLFQIPSHDPDDGEDHSSHHDDADKEKDHDDDGRDDHGPDQAVAVAVTRHGYGDGRSVWIGFDLLAQATAAKGEGLFTALLLAALDDTRPASPITIPGAPVSVRLDLHNQGIATPGRVWLQPGAEVLDSGASQRQDDGRLLWVFDLAEEANLSLEFWLRRPQDGSGMTVEALIQTGAAGDFNDYQTLNLTVPGGQAESLDQLLSSLDTYGKTFKHARREVAKAGEAMDKNKPGKAVKHLLKAAERLAKSSHPDAPSLHRHLAGILRGLARLL